MSFFFSSRRRHTSLVSDWSSDGALPISRLGLAPGGAMKKILIVEDEAKLAALEADYLKAEGFEPHCIANEIGRASCRERVSTRGGAEGYTEKTKETARGTGT